VDAISKKLSQFLKFTLRIFLVSTVLITFLQVIMRYVFNSPLIWAEETVGVIMIYFGLIGGSLGICYHIHISLEIFLKKFLRKQEKLIKYGEIFLYIVFGLIEIVCGIQIMMLTKFQVIPATGLPVPYTYLALPIAGIVMIIFAGELVVRLKRGDSHGLGNNYTIR
jgi:TRAP-type C4-dicarboxylate transport system permease small subunit